MDKTSFKSRPLTAFGVSMVFGGLALLLSVAILGFGTQSAFANGAQGPLAQGTQPIPVLTATSTVVATREPTGTVIATGTAVSTGTVVATTTAVGTAVTTGTVVVTGTAATTSTAVSTGTVVGGTATVEATSTTVPVATTEPYPTVGIEESPTPVTVGMPRTGTPVGGNNALTLTLLIVGVLMTTIGVASMAARRSSYKR